MIGFTASFVGSSIGAILGIASAYFGGRIDSFIQRIVDVLLAFPIIVLALVVVAAFRKSVIGGVDVNLIIAISIPILPRVARVVRAAAFSVRVMPYIDAARTAGYSNTRIIFRHRLPHRPPLAPYLERAVRRARVLDDVRAVEDAVACLARGLEPDDLHSSLNMPGGMLTVGEMVRAGR